jgi:hypothetical protein
MSGFKNVKKRWRLKRKMAKVQPKKFPTGIV